MSEKECLDLIRNLIKQFISCWGIAEAVQEDLDLFSSTGIIGKVPEFRMIIPAVRGQGVVQYKTLFCIKA